MRYESAKIEEVALGVVGVMAGVEGFEIEGVGGRNESVADRAGEGGIAGRGVGAKIAEPDVDADNLRGDKGVRMSGRCEGARAGDGPAMSTSTDLSLPLSTDTIFASGCESELTPGRRSYRIGENLTATLGFLCPGRRAMGGRAKFAREYI